MRTRYFENDNSCLSPKIIIMCLSPVTIPTQSRFISLAYKDKFLQSFPCGRCADCVSTLTNQWSYRANYEFDDLPFDGYAMFDCLTYRDSDIPRLSHFWPFLDRKHDDYPCFNPKHIRLFLQALRQRVIRLGFSPLSLRYYYACEYGTEPNKTHRPHIHLMLFVSDSGLTPYMLSSLVAELWKYGRTDGLPYKSHYYVMSHNVVRPSQTASRLRTIQYITKYLQKSCKFQTELDKRVSRVMFRLAEFVNPDNPSEWLESEFARRERLKLLRLVNQRSRTSQHFGESALRDIDLEQLFDSGCLYMPHSNKLRIAVPLSTYYKRKLFYDLVEVDGAKYWQLNELGIEYQNKRHDKLLSQLVERYKALSLHAKLDVDCVQLAKYVLDKRGRIKAANPSVTIEDRLNKLSYYNYSSVSDKMQFGCRGLSKYDLGNSQTGFKSLKLRGRVAIRDFIFRHVYLDSELENLLSKLNDSVTYIRDGKQKAYELRQHLSNIYKMLS